MDDEKKDRILDLFDEVVHVPGRSIVLDKFGQGEHEDVETYGRAMSGSGRF